MQQILETERLRIRPLSVEDSAFILALVNTQGWLKFIGDRNVKSIDDVVGYIAKIIENPNVIYNVFETKDASQAIGIVTLLTRDELPFPDIGFAILPDFGNKGYTFEASRNYLDALMGNTSIQTILGITLPDNITSINLLEKLGLKYEGSFLKDDEELLRYGTNIKANKRID